MRIYFLLPATYWCTSASAVTGSSPVHEIAISALWRSSLGGANTCPPPYYILSAPRMSLECFSSFISFLSAGLSHPSVLPSTAVLYPPNLSMGSVSFWFPPVMPFHTFSTTFSRLTHFLPFSHTVPSAMAGNLFLGLFFTPCCHFNYFVSLSVLSGYTLLLLFVLYYLSYSSILALFSRCHLCCCFQLFYELRVPSQYFSCLF